MSGRANEPRVTGGSKVNWKSQDGGNSCKSRAVKYIGSIHVFPDWCLETVSLSLSLSLSQQQQVRRCPECWTSRQGRRATQTLQIQLYIA